MKRRNFLGGIFAAVGYSVLRPALPPIVVEEALSSPAIDARLLTIAEVNAAIMEVMIPQIADIYLSQSKIWEKFIDDENS